MLIHHDFSPQPFEVVTTAFSVQDARVIDIHLREGVFEHVFLLVKDPEQQIRGVFTWKTRLKHFTLGESPETTSNNALPGKIQPGVWTITLIRPTYLTGYVAFEVITRHASPDEGKDRQQAVLSQRWNNPVNPAAKWYRGDLHCHSFYSDGRVSLDDICLSATANHFDYLAITDHSVITTALPRSFSPVIPATEITFDNEVHYNVFGLTRLIDYGRYFSREGITKNEILTALFHDLVTEGAVVSINHPFSQGMSLRHDVDMRYIQLFEVINAPHLADYPIDNEKAIRFYDFLWQQGYRLTATGGSDAHKPDSAGVYPLGKPTTFIHAHGLSIAGLLGGLKNGKTMIANGVNCQLHIRQRGRDIYPGDEVHGEIDFSATCESRPLTWRLIKNARCINEYVSDRFTGSAELNEGDSVRLEARTGDETVFFTTPVHCALSQPVEFSFAVLLARFLSAENNTRQDAAC